MITESESWFNFQHELNQQRMRSLYQVATEALTSPSHDRFHVDQTLVHARELAAWCKQQNWTIKWERIFAAACLHDLGRTNPKLHEKESIEASLARARPILSESGYDPEEIEAICQIIQEHDQMGLFSATPEALILKEADFLAGMGPWGIYRNLAWGVESGRDTSRIIKTLTEKIPARIASLRLPPAREIAWRQW